MPKFLSLLFSVDFSLETGTVGGKIRLYNVESSIKPFSPPITRLDLTFITSKIDRKPIYSGATS